MALLFIDSFDHYIDASDKYLFGGTAVAPGRHGNGYTGLLRCAPNPTHARGIVGAAYKFNTTFNQFLEINDTGILILATVDVGNDGSLGVTMFGGPSARSASDVVRVGQWHYIEVDFTVVVTPAGDPPTFETDYYEYHFSPVKVYLDGLLVLNVPDLGPTLVTTGASAHGWTHVDFFDAAAGVFDDVYICDGAGPAPHNAPLGDVRIDVIRPNGAGVLAQWTPNVALPNWDCVNDLVPDDDATRVSAAESGLVDLYEMEDIPGTGSILGAQLLINAKRTEEGSAHLTPLLRHAGTTTALVTRPVGTTYFYRNRDTFVTMPNGDPLTRANVNAMQAGMRRDL